MKELIEKKILWSTVVQVAGKVLQIAIGTLAIKSLTNALGPETYGFYGKITEFSLFFATAGNLGIFGNIIRKMADHATDSNLFWNAFLLRLNTAFFFFGLGLVYCLLQINDWAFFWGTLLFMSSLLLDHLSTVCNGALQAQYRMGRATVALLTGRLVYLGMVYALASTGTHNAHDFLLAPLFASLVTVALSLFFVSRHMKITSPWNSNLQKELFWTSLPFGITNLINSVYFRFLPSALLAKILTEKEYGVYNLSLHLSESAALLSTYLMLSILPSFKTALLHKQLSVAKQLYRKAKRWLLFLALLLLAGGSLCGPFLITLASNQDFTAGGLWLILPLLLLLAAVSYFYDLSFITLFAFNKDRVWLKREAWTLTTVSLFFAAAFYLPQDHTLKIALILIGAIAAEAAMALWGMKRSEELLA